MRRRDRRATVVGDSLLDRDWPGEAQRLCPDSAGPVVDLAAEVLRPGGAALTAVALAAQGVTTTLVTALGDDDAGRHVSDHLADAGVGVVDLGLAGPTPEKIRVRVRNATITRLDRGCATTAPPGRWSDEASDAVLSADAVLVSDYGRGLADDTAFTRALSALAHAGSTPVVWDPHPRGPAPHRSTTVATPSLVEGRALLHRDRAVAIDDPSLIAAALHHRWRCAIALTCGPDGVLLHDGARPHRVPTRPVDGDPCGAGDWFGAGVTAALAGGASLRDAVAAGHRSASQWIAGEHDITASAPGSPLEIARRRGRLVATSGCFDVLHVGHLAMLRHARSLGDHLVVLLNSDGSVRRSKGHGRPVNDQHDRAAVLAGLDCVDDVMIFDQATPCAALERLRPSIFVKGADYEQVDIPERAVMSQWGGTVAFAPLVADRSTTRILTIAGRIAG